MKDFVQHRLALEQAWQDTEPMDLAEISEPNFSTPIDPGYFDDLYTDVVRLCVIVYVWLLLYLIFTR